MNEEKSQLRTQQHKLCFPWKCLAAKYAHTLHLTETCYEWQMMAGTKLGIWLKHCKGPELMELDWLQEPEIPQGHAETVMKMTCVMTID